MPITYREYLVSTHSLGVLDLQFATRRVLSVPTQIGCAVGCTFCVSKDSPLTRNLTTDEMLSMIRPNLTGDLPIEVSFTGEGESLMNNREVNAVVEKLGHPVESIRYCASGLGIHKYLARMNVSRFPTRLQVSLHSAVQRTRDQLIPRSHNLHGILNSLNEVNGFQAIELNVVLQHGINDDEEHMLALAQWGKPEWPILLNPLLNYGRAIISPKTEWMRENLIARGRTVHVYNQVGEQISRQGIYPLMTARLRE